MARNYFGKTGIPGPGNFLKRGLYKKPIINWRDYETTHTLL